MEGELASDYARKAAELAAREAKISEAERMRDQLEEGGKHHSG